MKTEEGCEMYIDIHRLKQQGFSKSKIAKMLGISRPTVIKYLNMSAEEFEKEMLSRRQRKKKPDIYREEIITWLKQHPDMTAAQVFDRLEEKYRKLAFNEPTLRNYVRSIREEYNILKEPIIRQYEAVEDPPLGKQMQVDFALDEFNLEEQQTLSRQQFNQLKELSWLEKGFNLIFLGAPGVGKSHISIGLGIEAINSGYKVRFISMADLIHTLKTQEISSISRNSIKRIVDSDLVIIDDLMFMAMEKNEANLFFQLVNKLYGQTSIIITSNKGPEDWGELLGDPAITTAILDRLVHKCEIINIYDKDSYRMKHRQRIFTD
ncbi:ATP-binding protein [Desulfolucanica intricata]|uniref:ATP-binding protein n=1 Tax=Desulfolucanica intricata TaxID=1285191 RepID=UPI000A990FB9|nr:ATP-binding protein [Desulfolucanica intricata]